MNSQGKKRYSHLGAKKKKAENECTGSMKKYLRAVSVFAALLMLATTVLAGCGKGNVVNGIVATEGSDEILKIGVVNKGYGEAFSYKLAEAYQAKTGTETVVVKSSAADNWVTNALKSGAKNNDIDVFFDINYSAFNMVAAKEYLTGYERAFVDLSDIYDKPLDGYSTDKTLKELVFPYALNSSTWGNGTGEYGDDKQYFVNWATAVEGIVYNADLFEKYNLEVPRTTNEMFVLFDKINKLDNGSYAKNEDGFTVYPFAYSGKVNYLTYPAMVWLAQYDGIDSFNNQLQMKDDQGVYTAEHAKSVGKLSALNIVSKMLSQKNGYADANSYSQDFTSAQVLFLAGQSFMMCTGDWVEREMEANFDPDSMNIKFMRIPVNSDVVNKCDSVETDEQLAEVIRFIDGEGERPSYVSDADVAYLSSARSMYTSETNTHIAYIPAYSNNIDAAKDFLQFMLSKEGQEIMLENSYGNMAPLNIDVKEFDYASKLSSLQLSKFEILNNNGGATLVGPSWAHPMAYVNGLGMWGSDTMENVFGVVETSASFKTPQQYWQSIYERMSLNWKDKMTKAGVSN